MNNNISEKFKKILRRPLLFPAIILFVVVFVYLSWTKGTDTKFFDNSYAKILIIQTDYKFNGKNNYIGLINGNRYKINCNQDLYPGDILEVKGVSELPYEATNPGEFDYKDYLQTKGISYVFEVDEILTYNQSQVGYLITRIRYFIRDGVFDIVKGEVADNELALLGAFCLGDSSLVEQNTIRAFRTNNCSHLLAVSGSHFAGFLLLIPYFMDILEINPRSRRIFFLIAVIITGFMTGWTESVTRAAIMSICSLFMRDSISGMSFAAIVMLLANPYSALSSGFQMSFCATIGIICCNGKISASLFRFCRNKFLSEAIAVTLSAQIGVLIFSFINSTKYSLISFCVQIIGSFLIECLCVFFVLGLVFCTISDFAMFPCAFIANTICSIMNVTTRFSRYSFSFRNEYRLLPVLLMLLFICIYLRKCWLIRSCYKLIVVILSISIVSVVFYGLYDKPKTKILFVDVGQGDCCLIITERFNCLIDSGVNINGSKTIPEVLDYYSIDKLDFAIMTHWDEDHGGGMIELLKSGRVDMIYTSFVGENSNVNSFLSNYYEDDEIKNVLNDCFRELHINQLIELSENDKLKVIWPNYEPMTGDNPDSLVLNLETWGKNILFTGDIDIDCELSMIESSLLTSIDVLKVAHHGSKYSTSSDFLKYTNPSDAVISVGLHNYYGHPADEVIDRLGEVEANIYQTSKNGAIIVNIAKDGYKIDVFKENKYAF